VKSRSGWDGGALTAIYNAINFTEYRCPYFNNRSAIWHIKMYQAYVGDSGFLWQRFSETAIAPKSG